jgi:hypothetical protein
MLRIAVSVLVALLLPATASAAPKLTLMHGADAPGPAKYDKVGVIKVGPKHARHVLVLVPGTSAGAGYFVPDAQDLVKRLKGWQVWAVERRENLLEDHSRLDSARRGQISMQALFDYYLGWIGTTTTAPHYQPPADADVGFARKWGMRVAIGDLRRVVRAARRGGRHVVLGGHSLDGAIATAYATWDVRGRAAARDLDGLVLIDGGSGGSPISAADARTQLGALKTSSPFLDLTGIGLPWSAGLFAAVGSTLALREPDAPSTFASWRFAPAALKPPVPVTNEAQFGYVVDVDTGPASLALVQAHLGGLAPSGTPRGWQDGGLATVRRAARSLNGIAGSDGTAWFHPRRLSLDARAVAGGVRNPAQRVLGVHATHAHDVHLPIYAIETSLGKGRVLRAARSLARRSHVRRLTLVDRSATNAHCDPLFDDASGNAFLKTVVPFLRRLG